MRPTSKRTLKRMDPWITELTRMHVCRSVHGQLHRQTSERGEDLCFRGQLRGPAGCTYSQANAAGAMLSCTE